MIIYSRILSSEFFRIIDMEEIILLSIKILFYILNQIDNETRCIFDR